MLSISDALKNGCMNGLAEPACKVLIELESGESLVLTEANLWEGGFLMDDGVSGSGSFDIGQAIINRLVLKINNSDETYSGYDFTDARITAWRGGRMYAADGIVEKDITELLKCGVFTVDSQKTSESAITLECLDNLAKSEIPYSDVATAYPAAARVIVQDICNQCGIVLAASFDWSDYIVETRPEDEALTCRDVLHYIAQICGCFARCNASGALELKWYDADVFDKEEAEIHDIYALKSLEAAVNDVIITGIRVTDCEKDNSLFGAIGYVLDISSNPLISSGQAAAIAEHLGTKMVGMRFRPLETVCITDCSVEAGDPVRVTDRKGNVYQCWATNLTYTIGADYRLSCDAETPGENKAARYSESTKAIIELRKKIKEEKTERELALAELAGRLTASSGLYMTEEEQEDGSTIYYMHDKQLLVDSGIVWKLTAEAFGISTDGGETYPYGLDVSGTAILERIYTVGLDADYINSGSITARDKDGNIVFSVNVETGEVHIDASLITMKSQSLETYVNGIKQTADDAKKLAQSSKTLTVVLDNETHTVPTDTAGANGDYTDCSCGVMVLYGSADVTADAAITAAAGNGVTGSWDAASKRYTVSDLAGDIGTVNFTVTYDGITVTKTMSISKARAGPEGRDAVLLQIISSNGQMFKNSSVSTTLAVNIIVAGTLIASSREMYECFGNDAYIVWLQKRYGETSFSPINQDDGRISDNGFLFTVDAEDVNLQTVYTCELYY